MLGVRHVSATGTDTVKRTMSPPDDGKPAPSPTKRPQDWTAEEKWALVTEAATVPEAELGAFLRRKGVHEAQLAEWRAAAMAALQPPSRRERNASSEDPHIATAKRRLRCIALLGLPA
jgi:transposase